MKIAVDCRVLHGGGIGRFIREVTGPWLARDEVEAVSLLGDPDEIGSWLEGKPGRDRAEVVPWTDPSYSARVQLRAMGRVGRAIRDADVRFFPHYDAPVLGMREPSVVVVHDLTQFQPSAPFPLHKRVLGGMLLDTVVRRATRVVTVSENSRRDLAARVPSAEPHLRVVRPGVSETFRNGRNGHGKKSYLWDSFKPFLLTVGEPRPHKRIDFAVDLLAELRREGMSDLTLLSVGVAGGPDCPVRRRAVERGVSDSVVALGRVRDDTLRELYQTAEALVFPSTYEGFGLPVAEALSLGCPVLASDRGSIPEAADGSAVLLDPFDLEAWKTTFLGMPPRNGARGTDPSGWDRTSRQVFEVLREVVDVQPGKSVRASPLPDGPPSGLDGNGTPRDDGTASTAVAARRSESVAARTIPDRTDAALPDPGERTGVAGAVAAPEVERGVIATPAAEPPSWSTRTARRTFDVMVAALSLVLLAPVMAACALAVRATSGSPVIFGHRRRGRGGEPFECLKFRTMIPDAEELLERDEELRRRYEGNGYKVPRSEDPRITRVGHFLRYTHLDELPQLINVLRGDMSVVGPRPVVGKELREYGDDAETLLSVKPGIVGPWTAMGRSRPDYPERAAVEVSYIRRRSFPADLRVLARNVPVLLWGQTDE